MSSLDDQIDQAAAFQLATSQLRIRELEQQAVTRQGDAEQDIREHLDRYQALVRAIAQVIWTLDVNGEMPDDQLSWATYTGQTAEQYRGRGWLEAVHPGDREAIQKAWSIAAAKRSPFEIEQRLRRHDGEYRYFSVSAAPVESRSGAIREWAGIHSDITERKLAEQRLRDSERQFRDLADSMPQIVWAARPNGHFDYYNRRWYDYTGRPEGVEGDASWTDVVHPDDQKECLARWHAATSSGDSYEIEYRLREKSGTYHWFLRRALPVRDDSGNITRWFGTCTNIDAVKHTEAVLRRANVEADSANRELEAFSYSVAHDLRAPLRSIDGFSLAIIEDNGSALNPQAAEDLARVRAAAQRMARLIDDLLSLSRVSRTELRREPVNMTLMAREIGERLRQEQAPARTIDFTVQENLIVDADPALLAVALENLLGNAWKFTGAQPEAKIEVGRMVHDGRLAFFVRDNGAGFDMAYASKLFGAFQRLHPAADFPGTGIGLATVQRVVRRHGGQLWAHGETGRGATIFFTFDAGERT